MFNVVFLGGHGISLGNWIAALQIILNLSFIPHTSDWDLL